MIEPQSSDLNPWIRVASFEVYLILDRWGLSSVRDASVFLGISRHTLSKLSPSHPDGSLFPQPDTGTELSAIGEGAGEGGEREGRFVIEG